MGYINDYDSYKGNEKIPYDDTPVSRKNSGKSYYYQNQKQSNPSTVKILIALVSILVVINIGLVISTFYYLKNSLVKNVSTNYYTIETTTSTSSITSAASTSAKWSSINVGAGKDVTTEYQFYNSSSSRGAGVIYKMDDDGVYMITCYHVIEGYETTVYVMPPSSLVPIEVQVVGYSSHYDIAVLYSSDVDAFEGCTGITAYDSTYLSAGDYVFAVGNPLGKGTSVTAGVVSKLNTLITTDSNTYSQRVIQIDVAINAGNSGGGLFNNAGQFVGLVNAKLYTATSGSKTVVVEGVSYAIPANFVISIAKNIISKNGSPTCVNLGVDFEHDTNYGVTRYTQEVDGVLKEIDKYYVYVSYVTSGSIASGLLKVGDYINSITFTDLDGNTQIVTMFNQYSFEDICFLIKPNSEIIFNVTRTTGDTTVTIYATSFVEYLP